MFSTSVLANQVNEPEIIGSFRFTSMSELATASCHDTTLDDSNWTKVQFANLTGGQHLCIRGKLNIIKENIPESPALLFLALASYEVKLDGQLLGNNGQPGTSSKNEQVGGISAVLPLDISRLQLGEHLISIELSSFNVSSSLPAIAHSLTLIDQQTFYDTIIYASAATALLVGALLVMFVMFLALFFRFSRDPRFLIFSLLCLTTSLLLTAEQWKLFVNYRYDLHLLRLNIIIAVTLLVTILLPAYYLTQQATPRKKYWLGAVIVTQAISVLATQSYDERSVWLFIIALLFSVIINLLACRKKTTGAGVALSISGISLLSLLLAPRLFLELGFGLCIVLVLASIGLTLLNRLVEQRNLALESGKLKGELLRKNLQPHYLMNCLMQIQELIDIAPKQANDFVERLAEEFRALVVMSDKEVVTLEEELKLCRSHLKIMSVRYQQKYNLVVESKLDESKQLSNLFVPTAIVHSQIENCFTHNRITNDSSIVLNISCDNNLVTLELTTPVDNATEHKGVGIGEAYIRAKMAQVCQPGWRLQSQMQNDAWVTKYQYVLGRDNPGKV